MLKSILGGLLVAAALWSCGAREPVSAVAEVSEAASASPTATPEPEEMATTKPSESEPSSRQYAHAAPSSRPTTRPAPAPAKQPASRPTAKAVARPESVEFNHDEFDALLKKYVKAGLVRYGTWKKNKRDRQRLNAYLAAVAAADVSTMSRNEKLVFYINAYNAITVQSILDAYPVKSIMEIPEVWDREVWTVAGQTVSLNMIEHKILRPTYKDGRIHFVLVCAAIGCPPLQSVAYRAEGIDKQMDRVTREFLNNPARTKVDPDRRLLEISSLFDWYGEDFGAHPNERAAFVARFWNDPVTANALRNGEWTLQFQEYDWALNLAK